MKNLLFSVLICFATFPLCGQDYVAARTAREDLATLVDYIEQTHPDPYNAYGGEERFVQARRRAEAEIQGDSIAYYDLVDVLKRFMAVMQDGHTWIWDDRPGGPEVEYRVEFVTAPHGLLMGKVNGEPTEHSYKKILSVDGIPIEAWCAKVGDMYPAENIYASYNYLSNFLRSGWSGEGYNSFRSGPMLISVTNGDGTESVIELDPVPVRMEKEPAAESREPVEYTIVSDSVAVFRASSMYGREMARHFTGEMRETLGTLPGFAEEFHAVLSRMKESGIPYLIIDLRGNGGGYTQICLPALHMLYGDWMIPVTESMGYSRKISPLLLEKNGVDLQTYNSFFDADYKIGDMTPLYQDSYAGLTAKERRERFFQNMIYPEALDYLDQEGEPLYTPERVYVLTDAGTYSAAFHFAYYLWASGAVVAGTPSSQSPNCYMETTSFTLPGSGIRGSISNAMQVIFDAGDPMAEVFMPGLVPQEKDYLRHKDSQDPVMDWLLGEISSGAGKNEYCPAEGRF